MGAAPMFIHLLLAYLTLLSSFQLAFSSSFSSPSLCPKEPYFFLYGLQSQCPSSTTPIPPLQVNGDFLDGIFFGNQLTRYVAVLFYASWCPFSLEVLPAFETLNTVFPEIEHLVIEQSSAMPSVFSRYGIYSLPSILILNQTSRVHYRGPKSFTPLVQFYQRTTGMEPVEHYNGYQMVSHGGDEKTVIQLMKSLSFNEMVEREPYLVFSIIFLCFRVALLVFPEVLSRLKAFWVSHALHLNLQVFGETSQIKGRVLQTVFDLRRVWAKLRLSKARSFHESARNARVWASSLASVSLRKSSSGSSST